jgi:hypothetical protein
MLAGMTGTPSFTSGGRAPAAVAAHIAVAAAVHFVSVRHRGKDKPSGIGLA